mgnify:CR=1 FL=1
MTILFLILIILASALLGIIVLIQNPKGGGLSGTFGGLGNQIMGVKQTNDVLEKGTWLFAGIVGILCITSSMFFSGTTSSKGSEILKDIKKGSSTTAPATTPDATQNAVPFDSSK